jgi:hypothetical protein
MCGPPSARLPRFHFFPKMRMAREVVLLGIFYIGDADQGRKLIEPLLRFGVPHGSHIGAQPYTQWQKAFDPLLTPGAPETTGNPITSPNSAMAR